jgi:xanthine/uracil/vitamin C permease (AzgA family)
MDQGAVFVATCVTAVVSTLVMALYANYPIALAPGMGINAFFAFTVVLTYKYTWQQALAAVFCSGVLFFLISVLANTAIRHRFNSAESEAGRIGRRRAFSGNHRARGSQGHR